MCAVISFSWDLARQIDAYLEFLRTQPRSIRYLFNALHWIVLTFAAVAVVYRRPLRYAAEVGLAPGAGRAFAGVAFALACTAPMVIAPFASGGGVRSSIPFEQILGGVLIAPLIEELLFRGYLFGQLQRRAKFGFWVAALLSAGVFALIHLENPEVQAMSAGGKVAHLGIIAAGGVGYAWLFQAWKFNLWVPIGLHLFMNLWWQTLNMGETPVSGTLTIVARVAVVAIAITWTVLMMRGRVKDLR
jgi:membrane protease YdiL (CAAX protease family)